jgi:NADH-quinone oxidoreductase subunit I
MEEKDIIYITEPKLTVGERLYVAGLVKGFITTLRHFFKRKITVQYPEQRRPLYVENQRGFHRLNRDRQGRVKCVACMMCETACPAHCIFITAAPAPWPDREKYPSSFVIDELRCIYCRMCELACPVDAIELTQVFTPIGHTRQQMMYDKDMLLQLRDLTVEEKPEKQPKITDY